MSTISRTYTFSDGTDAFGSQIETEVATVSNAHNNHDTGTSVWTVVNSALFKRSGVQIYPIVQVVIQTSTTSFSTTSNTFQLTNCNATITPTSTANKILIFASGTLVNGNANVTDARASLFKSTTNLGGSAGFALIDTSLSGSPSVSTPCTLMYYDSPASVASTGYSVKILSSDNTNTVKFGFGSNDTQVMILVEIGN